MSGVTFLGLVVLAAFVGLGIATRVPTARQPALRSAATALQGLVLVGAVVVAGTAESGPALALGLLATVLATAGLVGGLVVTDRLLAPRAGRPPQPPDRGDVT